MERHVIALVDDDPAITMMLDDLLSNEGYRTFAVCAGEGAPAVIAQEKPNLVLLDLWMERQDTGWTVYDALRADEATATIPIIICSADIASVRAHAADLDARGDAAMEKPFDIAELLALVDRLLDRES